MIDPPRILGIDPGLEILGYGLVESGPKALRLCEAGIIRGKDGGNSELSARLLNLYNGLVEVIDQFHPQVMAVEQLYAHYKHPRTAILMGHARGVVFLTAAQRGLTVVSYPATRIKKTITGNGHASKEQ